MVPVLGAAGDVVNAGQKTVAGADIGQGRHQFQLAFQFQAPIPLAVAQAARQPFAVVAVLQVVRIKMDSFELAQLQADGAKPPPGVIDGINAGCAGCFREVGDSGKPLLGGVGGGHEQRDALVGAEGGKIGQIAGGAFQQVHHRNGPAGFDQQPPLAGAIAKPTPETGAAGFEFLRRKHTGLAGCQSQIDSPFGRRIAAVVHAGYRHLGGAVVGVDEAQLAHLVAVAAGVEDRHQVQGAGLGPSTGHQVVHAGQESVRGADVGQRLDVQVGFQFQAPISLAAAGAAGQSLGRVAHFQVVGVEMRCGFGAQGERDWSSPPAGIIHRVNADPARFGRPVDDADEALLHRVGGRHEQRNLMPRCQCHLGAGEDEGGAQHPKPAALRAELGENEAKGWDQQPKKGFGLACAIFSGEGLRGGGGGGAGGQKK